MRLPQAVISTLSHDNISANFPCEAGECNVTQVLDSDRAVGDHATDEFEFVAIAKSLAPRLIDAAGGDGLVVGLEGRWGSGKSSLMNLIHEQIDELDEDKVHVLTVAPWLNGDSSSLVPSLLNQIASIIEERSKRTSSEQAKKAALDAAASVAQYAQQTARWVSPLAKFAGLFLPGAEVTEKMIELVSKTANNVVEGGATIIEQKKKISSQIVAMDLKFIILLDDLDRLEPTQAIEVVRLVRSVADFPRIIYLMCYDRQVLANALKEALKVDDGDLFLQKIVQLSFQIPLPEPFDLRRKFLESALKIYNDNNKQPMSADMHTALCHAVDIEGMKLSTPREVKLTLNAIRFSYPSIVYDVYFPDLCRIHLIKSTNYKLFQWLEEYLSVRSYVATGQASVDRDERQLFGKRLFELAPSEHHSSSKSIFHISEYVPGIRRHNKPEESVFLKVHSIEEQENVSLKRIGSPIHYRFYFALTSPGSVMADNEVKDLLTQGAKGNTKRVTQKLITYADSPNQAKFDQLLFRLNNTFLAEIETETLETVVTAIFDVMDHLLEIQIEGGFGLSPLDERVVTLVNSILTEISKSNRAKMLEISEIAAEKGSAINWIVGRFFNSHLYINGFVSGESPARDNSLYSDEELKKIVTLLKSRCGEIETQNMICKLPRIRLYLFGWKNIFSDNCGPKKWVLAYCEDDANFLEFLKQSRYRVTSDKVYYLLEPDGVSEFLDWNETTARLERMREGEHAELVAQIEESIRKHQER